jgi:hypothetical protein
MCCMKRPEQTCNRPGVTETWDKFASLVDKIQLRHNHLKSLMVKKISLVLITSWNYYTNCILYPYTRVLTVDGHRIPRFCLETGCNNKPLRGEGQKGCPDLEGLRSLLDDRLMLPTAGPSERMP